MDTRQSIHEMALAEIDAREQARIDATMRETSPATVLARMEREQTLGRPGPLSSALVSALWGARGAAAVRANAQRELFDPGET